MKVEVYQSEPGNYNMQDYEQTYKDFDWKNVEQAFSWSKTGKINMAYECIDRHVDEGKGDKVALNYKDERRHESYTFEDMKKYSNKAANVLKNEADVKKGIEYLSLCQERQNCISLS